MFPLLCPSHGDTELLLYRLSRDSPLPFQEENPFNPPAAAATMNAAEQFQTIFPPTMETVLCFMFSLHVLAVCRLVLGLMGFAVFLKLLDAHARRFE